MKRPIPLYLVTCWLCLGIIFQIGGIGRWANHYQQIGEPTPPFILSLGLAALVVGVWLVWGFIRLRIVERWLCIAFFAFWAFSATWRIARLLLSADSARPISVRGLIVVAVIWLLVFIPNLASIAYLFTKRFRDFAVWYVEEKRREEMQRYAERQIQKGLKS
jgi:hypothetical protein